MKGPKYLLQNLVLHIFFMAGCSNRDIRIKIQEKTGIIIPVESIIVKQENTPEDSAFYTQTVQLRLLRKSDIEPVKRQIIFSQQYRIDNIMYKFHKENVRPGIELYLDTLNGVIEYHYEEKNKLSSS